MLQPELCVQYFKRKTGLKKKKILRIKNDGLPCMLNKRFKNSIQTSDPESRGSLELSNFYFIISSVHHINFFLSFLFLKKIFLFFLEGGGTETIAMKYLHRWEDDLYTDKRGWCFLKSWGQISQIQQHDFLLLQHLGGRSQEPFLKNSDSETTRVIKFVDKYPSIQRGITDIVVFIAM